MAKPRLDDSAWESIVGSILLFVLVVLCAGEPDLLDAITAWVGRQ